MLHLYLFPRTHGDESAPKRSQCAILEAELTRDLAGRLPLFGHLQCHFVAPPADPEALPSHSLWEALRHDPTVNNHALGPDDLLLTTHLQLTDDHASLTLKLHDHDPPRTWELRQPKAWLYSLNVSAVCLIHRHLGLEPSQRQRDAYAVVPSRHFDAIQRYFWVRHLGHTLTAIEQIKHLEHCLTLDPRFDHAALALAKCLFAVGRDHQARQRLERLAEDHPERLNTLLLAAQLLIQHADYLPAQNILSDILTHDPHNLRAIQLLSGALLARGDFAEATFVIREALWRFPTDPLLGRYDAALTLQEGELAAAAAKLERLATANPEQADIWVDLGATAMALGDFDTAQHAWDKVTRQAQPFPEAEGPKAILALALADGATAASAIHELNTVAPDHRLMAALFARYGDPSLALANDPTLSALNTHAAPSSPATLAACEAGLRLGQIEAIDATCQAWERAHLATIDQHLLALWRLDISLQKDEQTAAFAFYHQCAPPIQASLRAYAKHLVLVAQATRQMTLALAAAHFCRHFFPQELRLWHCIARALVALDAAPEATSILEQAYAETPHLLTLLPWLDLLREQHGLGAARAALRGAPGQALPQAQHTVAALALAISTAATPDIERHLHTLTSGDLDPVACDLLCAWHSTSTAWAAPLVAYLQAGHWRRLALTQQALRLRLACTCLDAHHPLFAQDWTHLANGVDGHCALGFLALRRSQEAMAATHFSTALAEAPQHLVLLQQRTYLHLQRQEYSEALRRLRTLIEHHYPEPGMIYLVHECLSHACIPEEDL